MEDTPSLWKIEIEEVVPYSGGKTFWHCRIQNRGLGYVTANDGDTPDQAVSRAKMTIIMTIMDDMRSEMADILNEMEKVMDLTPLTSI